jgi:hypothetical protein
MSCAGAPKTADPILEAGEFIPLESGGLVYLYIDVKNARPILDIIPLFGMNKKQSDQILDMTQTAVAALYPNDAGRSFQALAWGKYPNVRASQAFSLSRDWKKKKSKTGAGYWRSDRDGISIALNAAQAYVSDGDPFSAAPGVRLPDGFGEFIKGSVLACWLNEPSKPLNEFLSKMGLPIQIPAEELFLSVVPLDAASSPSESDRVWETLIRIKTPEPSQARGIVTMINMARVFLFSGEGPDDTLSLLFANAPVLDGPYLLFRTAALTEKDMALLFSLFALYSSQ